MPDASTLKQRVRNGDPIKIVGATVHTSETALQALVHNESPDLLSVDLQHSPVNEDKLREFCAITKRTGTPVNLRLKHTRQAHLAGNFLDHGPIGIVIPQIDTEATVDEAINAFYYPPVGKRSWGPFGAYGYDASMGRRGYADWWNQTGILTIQIESIDAVVNARKLARPGVDMIMFGGNDLSFDIETYPDPPFTTFEECLDHVERQMKGTGVRVWAHPALTG